MSWSPASDGETPAPGLTYNVYVKFNNFSDPEYFVMTPFSNLTTGKRKVAQRGNVDHNLRWSISLPEWTGSVSWGIQAIDNQFIGSEFANSEGTYFFEDASAQIPTNICGTISNNMNYQSKASVTTPGGTCQSTIIPSGSTATITATNSISLKPGFTASAGSNFQAFIRSGGGLNGPCGVSPSASRIASGNVTEIQLEDEKIADAEIVQIFPNPTRDIFKLTAVFTQQKKVNVSILDMRGILMVSKDYQYADELVDSFNLSQMPSGVYLVKVTTELGVKTLKVLKE